MNLVVDIEIAVAVYTMCKKTINKIWEQLINAVH